MPNIDRTRAQNARGQLRPLLALLVLALNGCAPENSSAHPMPAVLVDPEFRRVFEDGDREQALALCRERIYAHLPFTAPLQAVAVSATQIDTYFYLTAKKHAPQHVRCNAHGLSEALATHPYASLLPSEREAFGEEPPVLPHQNLWSEAWMQLHWIGSPDVLEVFWRPDDGSVVIRRWTRGAGGWISELTPPDAPIPGLAITASEIPVPTPIAAADR